MAMYEPACLPPNAEEQDFIQAYENVREKYKDDRFPQGLLDVDLMRQQLEERRETYVYSGDAEAPVTESIQQYPGPGRDRHLG
ncbi:hypothetical protein J4Q44_G00016930 [Coregonus suidteri]|uniref:Uncharacterized protein n=1 Tax=Coregonus suidteri TaxID=861788 RepID=A0AAN8MAP0_9TELE